MTPQSEPLILAFDCACSGLSVAVARGETVLAAAALDQATGQAASLAPAIQAALRQAGVAPAQLDLIGVTTGPGSFTGIRIGLAMARGLALALDRPLAACSTFEATLASLPRPHRREFLADAGRIVLAIDSRRAEIFVAEGDGDTVRDMRAAPPQNVVAALPTGRYALLGDAAPALNTAFASAGRGAEIALYDARPPQAEAFAPLLAARGADYWRTSNAGAGLPRPLYLRGADVTLPGGGGRVQAP